MNLGDLVENSQTKIHRITINSYPVFVDKDGNVGLLNKNENNCGVTFTY